MNVRDVESSDQRTDVGFPRGRDGIEGRSDLLEAVKCLNVATKRYRDRKSPIESGRTARSRQTSACARLSAI